MTITELTRLIGEFKPTSSDGRARTIHAERIDESITQIATNNDAHATNNTLYRLHEWMPSTWAASTTHARIWNVSKSQMLHNNYHAIMQGTCIYHSTRPTVHHQTPLLARYVCNSESSLYNTTWHSVMAQYRLTERTALDLIISESSVTGN